jgi:hypothetical protein
MRESKQAVGSVSLPTACCVSCRAAGVPKKLGDEPVAQFEMTLSVKMKA